VQPLLAVVLEESEVRGEALDYLTARLTNGK
jgi:hypothetical protein